MKKYFFWKTNEKGVHPLNESLKTFKKKDSKWPVFFPSNNSFLLFKNKNDYIVEKLTGATVVNRFPLIIGFSISSKNLSRRHVNKTSIIKKLVTNKKFSINLIEHKNIDKLITKNSFYNNIHIDKLNVEKHFDCINFAYQSIECKFLRKIKIYSHTLILAEINKITINKKDIKKKYLLWKPLPEINKKILFTLKKNTKIDYMKRFTNNYRYDFLNNSDHYIRSKENKNFISYKIKKFKLSEQIKLNNNQAKWPIFFPSSLGIIGSSKNNKPNFMPCGSTFVVSRFPMTIGIAISHSKINERYRFRNTLNNIIKNKKFTVGVPFNNAKLIKWINFMGNITSVDHPKKMDFMNFNYKKNNYGPYLNEIPITLMCESVKKIKMKTHTLIIGKIKKYFISKENFLFKWSPFANLK